MCLIKGNENKVSEENHYLMTSNFPKQDKVSIASFYAMRQFTTFEMVKSASSGLLYLKPVNPIPNTPDNFLRHESFEIFRDWAIIEITGEWPENRSVFKRSEVLIEFVEHSRYISGPRGNVSYVKDVKEVARFNPNFLKVVHSR